MSSSSANTSPWGTPEQFFTKKREHSITPPTTPQQSRVVYKPEDSSRAISPTFSFTPNAKEPWTATTFPAFKGPSFLQPAPAHAPSAKPGSAASSFVPPHHLPISPPSTDPRPGIIGAARNAAGSRTTGAVKSAFDSSSESPTRLSSRPALSLVSPSDGQGSTAPWRPVSSFSIGQKDGRSAAFGPINRPLFSPSAKDVDKERDLDLSRFFSSSLTLKEESSDQIADKHARALEAQKIHSFNRDRQSNPSAGWSPASRVESIAEKPESRKEGGSALASGPQQTFERASPDPALPRNATRYLMLSGIPRPERGEDYDTIEISACLEKYGKLRCLYARDIHKTDSVILSFYDVREASSAYHAIPGDLHPIFRYHRLSTSFLSRDDFLKLADGFFYSDCLSVGEGRLIIKANSPVHFFALKAYLRGFGDIQRLTKEEKQGEADFYLLEYYDDRAAERAFKAISQDVNLVLEVAWDDLQTLDQHRNGSAPSTAAFTSPSSASQTGTHRSQASESSGTGSLPEGFISAATSPSKLSHVPNNPSQNSSYYCGLLRDDPTPDKNIIYLERILTGEEKRTSCILRNLPNRMTVMDLMENLDEVVPRGYDFVYLRIDFTSGSNCGFGFVNFITMEDVERFWRARLNKMWDPSNSRKMAMGGFADIQGKRALIERFRNSSVMDQNEDFRPKIFFTSGPNKGLPEPFPSSNNALRKQRSAQGSHRFGLYGNRPKGGFRSVPLHML